MKKRKNWEEYIQKIKTCDHVRNFHHCFIILVSLCVCVCVNTNTNTDFLDLMVKVINIPRRPKSKAQSWIFLKINKRTMLFQRLIPDENPRSLALTKHKYGLMLADPSQ